MTVGNWRGGVAKTSEVPGLGRGVHRNRLTGHDRFGWRIENSEQSSRRIAVRLCVGCAKEKTENSIYDRSVGSSRHKVEIE